MPTPIVNIIFMLLSLRRPVRHSSDKLSSTFLLSIAISDHDHDLEYDAEEDAAWATITPEVMP